MSSKIDLLKLIDFNFLEDFILNFNNKPRYHSFDSKESLIRFCSKKFNDEQVREIFDSFKLGMQPADVANMMKELSGHKLGLKFIEKIKPKNYMFEVNLDGSICDLVFLDTNLNLVAIEIKANGDNVMRAPGQCERYRKWADFVYIMVEEKNYDIVRSIIPKWIGLIVYKNNKNKFLVFHPKKSNSPDLSFILENISKEKLEHLARIYRIKVTGKKPDLISRLKPMLMNNKFVNDLKISLVK